MSIKTEFSAITLDRMRELQTLIAAPDEAALDNRQAAVFLNLAPQTLEVWRSTRRQQIPYIKIGKSVRYLLGDLRKFQADCRVDLSISVGEVR